MATIPRNRAGRKVEYPKGDGKPMAESGTHAWLMVDLIQTLQALFEAEPMAYVSGNLMLFYEEGNGRKHISPDVFAVRGIPKGRRDYYLTWEEGKGPDVALEITSKTTRSEDVKKKMALYRDVLRVSEYFLFDPFGDYLTPPMQGYRLVDGEYEQIGTVARRLPSEVLGLHLERDGTQLRLYDPATGQRLPTTLERAEAERTRADQAEAENARLREELEALRRRGEGGRA